MEPDALSRPTAPPSARRPVAVRDQVLKAAARLDGEPAPTALFLALLQDRLPTWIRMLEALTERPSGRPPDETLTWVAESTIEFYTEMQTAGLGAFTTIHNLVRIRRALHAHDLHYRHAIDPLARYLQTERAAGRVTPDADPRDTAELLLAGCFNRAFEELLLGTEALPPRRDRAVRLIRALRLT